MSKHSSQKRRIDVVTTVFPKAVSLLDYCNRIIDGGLQLIGVDDSAAYKELLSTSLIVPPENKQTFTVCKNNTCAIRDIISRFVGQLVRSNQPYHEQNCLALGFRPKSSYSNVTMRANNDTEMVFVNTVQALVNTQTWQLLANRIG